MKQQGRIATVITWCIMNTIWYACAIMGTVYHEHHFLSVFKFMTWLMVVMWSLCIVGKFSTMFLNEDFQMPKRYIPAMVGFISDFGLATIAAAGGFWFYAILIMYQCVAEQMYFKPETKERKQNAN
jgi:hypothetical protein